MEPKPQIERERERERSRKKRPSKRKRFYPRRTTAKTSGRQLLAVMDGETTATASTEVSGGW